VRYHAQFSEIASMLDAHLLPLFLAAVFALIIVPGPDMMLIVAQSVGRGARYGVACSVGVMLAGLIQTTLVASGLGHAMENWPTVAIAIRLCGAAYMAWLGAKLLLGWWHGGRATPISATKATESSIGRLVGVAIANNLLNPKALLFFSLFLPQFVNPALGHSTAQLLLLGLLLTFIAFAFNLVLSLLAASLRRLSGRSAGLACHGNGLLGALFLLLASRLAWARTA
jgi:threonine/homoserine/homoserine lactone efflux protein